MTGQTDSCLVTALSFLLLTAPSVWELFISIRGLRTSFDVKSDFSEGLWKYSWLAAEKWRTDPLGGFGGFTCLLEGLCRGPVFVCRGSRVHVLLMCKITGSILLEASSESQKVFPKRCILQCFLSLRLAHYSHVTASVA